jgi:hypothetical protein
MDSKRFWMAPKVLRRSLIEVSAASTRWIVIGAIHCKHVGVLQVA